MTDEEVAAEKDRRRADPVVEAIIAHGYPPGHPIDRDLAEDAAVRGGHRIARLRSEGASDAEIARVLCGSRRYWTHHS